MQSNPAKISLKERILLMSRYAANNYIAQLKRSRWTTTLIVIVILFVGTVVALRGDTGSVTAQVDSAMLGVLGTYGNATFVPLEEIEDFWLTDTIEIGTCIEGEETKNTASGVYSNEEFGEYTLHIYTDSEPHLVVRYGEGKTVVFNLGRERLTKGIYEDLEEACG